MIVIKRKAKNKFFIFLQKKYYQHANQLISQKLNGDRNYRKLLTLESENNIF